jgi:ribosomal protein S18 acetylase RimI-like enzyme
MLSYQVQVIGPAGQVPVAVAGSAAGSSNTNEQLVGAVALKVSAKPKTRHKAPVNGMFVSPSARRCGAGKALLATAMAHAPVRAGVLVLTLNVTQGNEAAIPIRLYRAAGFEEFGTEPMAILTPGGFKGKVHMWHRLAQASTAA